MKESLPLEDSSKGLSHTRPHKEDQTVIRIKHNPLTALLLLTRCLFNKDIFLLTKKYLIEKKKTQKHG